MPNPENIADKKFPKGQSGNPKGRPKGARNRSTVAREWLEVAQKIKNPITGAEETLEQQDIMTLALIKKAREGDVSAYRELMDSAYGKSLNIDHKNNGGSFDNIDLKQVSTEDLERLLKEHGK
jgi:hypothetical protein